MKNKIKIILIIVLVANIVISTFYLLKNQQEDKEQDKIFSEIQEIIKEEDTEEKREDTINIDKLYEINNDIVAWVKIEGTNINYPVMQTKDRPDYYLYKNFYKKYSISGTPYMAESCDIETSDNLIIYGHNMSNHRIFGELKYYKKEEYCKSHNIINLYTMNGITKYEVMAVLRTNINTGFKYYRFYKAQDEGEFDTFVKKCKELSFFDTGVTAKYGEKILTLSTCEGSQKDVRFIVVAKSIS